MAEDLGKSEGGGESLRPRSGQVIRSSEARRTLPLRAGYSLPSGDGADVSMGGDSEPDDGD